MQRQSQRLRTANQVLESSKAQQLKVFAAAWRAQADNAIKSLRDLDLDRPCQQVDSRTCLTSIQHICYIAPVMQIYIITGMTNICYDLYREALSPRQLADQKCHCQLSLP